MPAITTTPAIHLARRRCFGVQVAIFARWSCTTAADFAALRFALVLQIAAWRSINTRRRRSSQPRRAPRLRVRTSLRPSHSTAGGRGEDRAGRPDARPRNAEDERLPRQHEPQRHSAPTSTEGARGVLSKPRCHREVDDASFANAPGTGIRNNNSTLSERSFRVWRRGAAVRDTTRRCTNDRSAPRAAR